MRERAFAKRGARRFGDTRPAPAAVVTPAQLDFMVSREWLWKRIRGGDRDVLRALWVWQTPQAHRAKRLPKQLHPWAVNAAAKWLRNNWQGVKARLEGKSGVAMSLDEAKERWKEEAQKELEWQEVNDGFAWARELGATWEVLGQEA